MVKYNLNMKLNYINLRIKGIRRYKRFNDRNIKNLKLEV